MLTKKCLLPRHLFKSFSLSHSEPNIATTFWRRSRRKAIAEQRTASSRFFLISSCFVLVSFKFSVLSFEDSELLIVHHARFHVLVGLGSKDHQFYF